jgi:arabinoxylan arabinofuranohydrolase
MMRKACMEPIFFNDDGSINEVEMTSQGAGPPLSAFTVIPAERACLLQGNVRIQAFREDNEELAGIRNEDRAAFKYVDFRNGADSILVRVMPGESSGGISFMADMPWGPRIGYMKVPAAGDEKNWTTLAVPAGKEKVGGVRALWLVFDGEGDELFSVDWLQFRDASQ